MNVMHVRRRIVGGLRGATLVAVAAIGSGRATAVLAQDAIAAGENHACAVIDGALNCWGANDLSQLGNGTAVPSPKPTLVDTLEGSVSSAAAGRYHTCAVSDGALSCWGYNGSGQLGNDSIQGIAPTPVPVVGLGSGVLKVSAGDLHTCAIADDGLSCWGANDKGQLGTGDTLGVGIPAQIFAAGSGATSVAAGAAHTCAIVNQVAYCWGDNQHGQLGTPNPPDPTVPVAIAGLSGAVSVAAGKDFSCAILNTGSGVCWGRNDSGQLGTGNYVDSPTPVAVSNIGNAIAVVAGARHACALLNGGTVKCWGYGIYGQLGNGSRITDSAMPLAVVGLDHVTALAAGRDYSCASTAQGVYCWGRDESGTLGNAGPDNAYVATPTLSLLPGLTNLAAGSTHGCARDGNGDAYCWGDNFIGQLGNGTSIDAAIPTAVTVNGTPLNGAASFAAGNTHTCALMSSNGSARCWGANYSGQLGNGTTISSSQPVVVSGLSGATHVAAGSAHSCALILLNGHVECWGKNDDGQLGNLSTDQSLTPVTVMIVSGVIPVPLSSATDISAGRNFNCAIVNGGARCWGANASGQLGNGSTDPSQSAEPVVGLGNNSSVSTIAAGDYHTCAIVNGGVQCWGENGSGQLGTGDNDSSSVPVAVPDLPSGVTRIASGSTHTCAVVNSGVKCWGSNQYGELGNGVYGERSNVPVTAIPAGSNITELIAGSGYTCAANANGESFCWGNGMFGRLGNGELNYSAVPVHVFERLFADDFELHESGGISPD